MAVAAAAFVATVVAGAFVIQRGEEPAREPARPVAAPAPGEHIAIPTLGLSVVRPQAWTTITAEENVRNLRSVQMDDAELQELAARYAATPIVAFAKHKEPYGDLNPSFKINVRPIGGFAGRGADDILLAAIPTMQRMFGDLKIEHAPTQTTVAGRAASYARLSYTMRAGGNQFPTVSEIWIVPRGSIFFMIGAGTRADEKTGSRAEVRAIVDSIRIH